MADVGNVDAHFPQPLLQFTDTEGVVEVFRVVRVDGESQHISHVESASNLFLSDARSELLGRFLHGWRIDVRQSVLGQDSVHLGIILAGLAKYVNHFANRVLGSVRPPFEPAEFPRKSCRFA